VANDISIIIPTYNGGTTFSQSLDLIARQKYPGKIQLIVIDSGSSDGTPEAAAAVGATVKRIKQKDFNHSRTRNEAVALAKYPKVVFLVQDAIPISEEWLLNLSSTLDDDSISAAYGKQIPHDDADLYAHFEVEYHNEYLGNEPVVQSISSPASYAELSYDEALRKIRFDNVCSVYLKDMLLKYPFPEIDFGEDMAWAHHVMIRGFNVLFQPKVMVKHSHNRSHEYRFRRAIVDSVACAKVLDRVAEDLSFLTGLDLLDISKMVEDNIDFFKCKNMPENAYNTYKIKKSRNYFENTIKNLPFLKRIFFSLLSLLPQDSRQKAWEFAFIKSVENHIEFVISIIKEKNPDAKKEQIDNCVDQVVASILGRLYGEVFSSYKLVGKCSKDIDMIVLPQMKGV